METQRVMDSDALWMMMAMISGENLNPLRENYEMTCAQSQMRNTYNHWSKAI